MLVVAGGVFATTVPARAATAADAQSKSPAAAAPLRPERLVSVRRSGAHQPAPTTTTTTIPAAAPEAAPKAAVPTTPSPATGYHPAPVDPGYGCGPALAWLSAHAAPGFRFVCPGYALGHQAMTCQNVAGVCPNGRLIVISDPCEAAYKNEAYNSWIVEGLASGSYDPYGYCHNG